MTKQRQLIFDIVQEQPHSSAEQIFLAAKRQMPHLALATVYRNLKLLAEDGCIRQFVVPNGIAHYDKTLTPHEHLKCSRCGRIVDLPISDLTDTIERQAHVKVDACTLSIEGRCGDCLAAEDNNKA